MKPLQIIADQKKVIEQLTFELKYSKNKEKDAKRINTLIKTVNCFNDMLVSKYKTDALDALIYALIYELLMIYKAYQKEIPLHDIIKTVDDCFMYGSKLKKEQCISVLKHHELNNKIKNNSVFNQDYADFNFILADLINQLKQPLKWN